MKPDAFRPLQFTSLDLAFNQITEIPAQTFQNFQYLREIIFHYNKIQMIRVGAFVNLPALSHLHLRFNSLQELSEESFFGLYSVRLFVSGNMIGQQIMGSSPIFGSLPHLHQLRLPKNCIRIITRGIFRNLTWLKLLELSHNNLLNVDKGSFTHLEHLQVLQLLQATLKVPRKVAVQLKYTLIQRNLLVSDISVGSNNGSRINLYTGLSHSIWKSYFGFQVSMSIFSTVETSKPIVQRG